jgi:predicted pyridoxine 5'-phosphate oxidase superfamily flavin-nucleotide-binding protein
MTGWHEGELAVQRRAGVTDHEKLRNGVRDALPPHFRAFLEVQRFVVLATVDEQDRLWCSMVAGWPGFATTPTPTEVKLHRDAFGDADVIRHLEHDARVGMLALDPSTRRRIRVNGTARIDADAITIHLVETFGNCQQYIQKRQAEGPAPRPLTIAGRSSALEPHQREWIARADTCFLASMHPTAGPDASHRGGRPGFVEVVDERTLQFFDYDGNNMFQTLGNLTANPVAAMVFVDFERGATLQLLGEAQVEWDNHRSPTGRAVRFGTSLVVEKEPTSPWSWPVVEYSPVNPVI